MTGRAMTRACMLFVMILLAGCAAAPKMDVQEVHDNNGKPLEPGKCYRVNEMLGGYTVGGTVDQEHAIVCVAQDGTVNWQTTTASSGPNTGHIIAAPLIYTFGDIVTTRMNNVTAKHISNQQRQASENASPGVVFQVQGGQGNAAALTNTDVGVSVSTEQTAVHVPVQQAPPPPPVAPPPPPSHPPMKYMPRGVDLH